MRHDGSPLATHGFGFGGQLDHRALQHHLLDLQLMGDQRQQPDVKAHIIRANNGFFSARRGQGHAARENAELRPDVPAQRPIELELIAATIRHLFNHIGAKIVGVDQQYQRGKTGDNYRQ